MVVVGESPRMRPKTVPSFAMALANKAVERTGLLSK